jgi:hypothetical protein
MQMFRASSMCYVIVDGRRAGVWRAGCGNENSRNGKNSRALFRQNLGANNIAKMKKLGVVFLT